MGKDYAQDKKVQKLIGSLLVIYQFFGTVALILLVHWFLVFVILFDSHRNRKSRDTGPRGSYHQIYTEVCKNHTIRWILLLCAFLRIQTLKLIMIYSTVSLVNVSKLLKLNMIIIGVIITWRRANSITK